jgi:hypothetical protein
VVCRSEFYDRNSQTWLALGLQTQIQCKHGTIALNSVLGKGTTVELRLPLNQPKA